MKNGIDFLNSAFLNWGAALGLPAPFSEVLWGQVLRRYQAEARYYHNLQHLIDMFMLLERYRDYLRHPFEVKTAIIFHDWVYDAAAKDNERASAVQMRVNLGAMSLNLNLDRAESYILATERHVWPEEAEDRDGAWFLDFDLAVLARPWPEYRKYALEVEAEYLLAFKPEDFNRGRIEALERFLSRKFLYFSPIFRADYEGKARENLDLELKLRKRGWSWPEND